MTVSLSFHLLASQCSTCKESPWCSPGPVSALSNWRRCRFWQLVSEAPFLCVVTSVCLAYLLLVTFNLQRATCGTRHKQSSAISVSAMIDSSSHAQLLCEYVL